MAELEAERMHRKSEFKELRQTHNTLKDRGAALARAFNAKDVELTRSAETVVALNHRVKALEDDIATRLQASEKALEELTAALRREKHERAVAEGSPETGRKDLVRLTRDVMALQRTSRRASPNSIRSPPTPPESPALDLAQGLAARLRVSLRAIPIPAGAAGLPDAIPHQ